MPKIVILGSAGKYGPYKITYPIAHPTLHNTEEGYKWACERFYPAIDKADIVIVYGKPGDHTKRDIEYAESKSKKVVFVGD